jgi:5-methylcytosine-specific restriction endonuclease McrA
VSDVPAATREFVWERDNGQCQVCGTSRDVECHHVVFRSHGGGHEPDNLTLLCAACHRLVHGGRLRVIRRNNHTFWEGTHDQAV